MSHTRKLTWAVLVTALAMLGYLIAVWIADQAQILASLRKLGVVQIMLILGLSLANYGLRFIRWRQFINHLGHRVPARRHLAYYVAGFAFTVTPGKAGEGIRAIYLKPHGVNYMDSLAALFVERLQDLLAIGLLSVLVIYQFPDYQWLVLAALLLVALFTWLVGVPALPARLLKLEKGLAIRQLGILLRHVAGMLDASARLRKPGPFGVGMLLGVTAWAAEGLALYFILIWLGMDIDVSLAIGIYAISLLAGAASFLPGGLGGTELTMGVLLALCGASPSTAVAATLICRLTTLWFAVGLGAASIALISTSQTVDAKHGIDH